MANLSAVVDSKGVTNDSQGGHAQITQACHWLAVSLSLAVSIHGQDDPSISSNMTKETVLAGLV